MSDHTTPGSSRSARAGRELALTIGAVAGLICVLAAAASMLFGIKPLVFRSGSMSPEITTGSLALARTVPATDLSVGDIVSVVNGQGTRITHRVYELDQQAGNSVTVTLKGDANAKPDVEPYFITEADRIFFSVGGLGYAIAWLSSPLAIFLGGALVGGLVIIAFRPNSRRKDSDDGPSGGVGSVDTEAAATMEFPMVSSNSGTGGHRSAFSLRKLAVLGVSAFALIGVTQVSGTAAAFTDTAVATSGAITVSGKINPATSSVSCTTNGIGGSQSSTVKWSHIGPPISLRGAVLQRKLVDENMGIRSRCWCRSRNPGLIHYLLHRCWLQRFQHIHVHASHLHDQPNHGRIVNGLARVEPTPTCVSDKHLLLQ